MSEHRHDWWAIYRRRHNSLERVGSACDCGEVDRKILMPYDVGATINSMALAFDRSRTSIRHAIMVGRIDPIATVDGTQVFDEAAVEMITGRQA